jgi:sporulation protein YlmC with PRC-barrel domain
MRTLDYCDFSADSIPAVAARRRATGSTLELTGADNFIGDPVYSRRGEYLGSVMEIMLDMESGKIAHAVVSQGEAFYQSGSMVAIPWQALVRGDSSNHRFTLQVDKQFFDEAAGFDYDSWPDMDAAVWSPHAFTQETAEA